METKKQILVVSFGTAYAERRERAIGGVEKAIAQAFPEYQVKRAFTSGMVTRKIEREEGIHIDSPAQALEQAAADGVQELVTLTTHVMDGQEYWKFMCVLAQYEGKFERVINVGPMIRDNSDLDGMIAAVREVTAEFDDGNTGIVLVGHGSEDPANHVYADLQERLLALGLNHYFVGTIEADPSYDTVLEMAKNTGVSKLVLMPFMVVAGDHAINDLGSEEEDSWKSLLEKEGFTVSVIQHGLGEFEKVQQLYVQHTKEAIGKR